MASLSASRNVLGRDVEISLTAAVSRLIDRFSTFRQLPSFRNRLAALRMSGMAINEGEWPVDPATETGLFRTELGDVVGVPHEPSDGMADFEFIGDTGIVALILAYPSSRDTALSKAMTSMANQMIAAAQDIQVDDIRIKTVERANLMFQMATSLAGNAIIADASNAFEVVPLYSTTSFGIRIPQGTPRPSGLSGF